MRISITFLLVFALMSSFARSSHADHQGPERVADGKYTIILSIIPAGDRSLELRFFFTDTQTGKRVSDIKPAIFINDPDGNPLLQNKAMTVENGVASITYVFPKSGLFSIVLEIMKEGDPTIYRPEEWFVWVPGEDGTAPGSSYPIGMSEVVTIGLFLTAVVVVVRSFIVHRNRG